MAINREIRRMNYVGASDEHRAAMRRIMTDGLASVSEQARPELAADLRETLAIFDEVDASEARPSPVERLAATADEFMAVIEAEPIPADVKARIAFAAGVLHGEALKALAEVARG